VTYPVFFFTQNNTSKKDSENTGHIITVEDFTLTSGERSSHTFTVDRFINLLILKPLKITIGSSKFKAGH
jgi:hypothetical protein